MKNYTNIIARNTKLSQKVFPCEIKCLKERSRVKNSYNFAVFCDLKRRLKIEKLVGTRLIITNLNFSVYIKVWGNTHLVSFVLDLCPWKNQLQVNLTKTIYMV